MRTQIALGSIALALLSVACAPRVSYMSLNSPGRPMTQRPVESVEMFRTERPSHPFIEVGAIQAAGGNAFIAEFEYMTAIRREAAKVGCDGVVVTGIDKGAWGSYGGGSVLAHEKVEGVRAVCVVYRD